MQESLISFIHDTSSLDCIYNDNYISLIYNTRNSDLIECILLTNFFSLDELQECMEYFIDYDTVGMYQLDKLYLCVKDFGFIEDSPFAFLLDLGMKKLMYQEYFLVG